MVRKLYLCLFFIISVQSKKLPDYLQDLRCSVENDFDACFVKNANKAIPLVARGDPNLNIPKMNPLEIPFMRMISTPTLQLNLTDVKVYGLEKMKVLENKFDWDKSLFAITLKGENITVTGQYSIDGNVLVMPIKGEGPFSVLLDNGVYKVRCVVPTIQKDDGLLYFSLTDIEANYVFKRIVFNFENLFEGNEELGKQTNEFLNENWDLLVSDFGPGIANIIASMIKKVSDGITQVVPIQDFFII
ncbi:hypothetical protein HHI36_013787 [Cryptolaemus montrouzieri]|uniref:Uncharacterized protein n=1 Tax=Cryptolaemus montrouzieri TaxID=559131 RepID=A0ABD2NIF6_9CUCU